MASSLRDLNYYYQQNSFAGGELSPDMFGRNDFNKYPTGCSDIENMYPLPFGNLVTRAGTEFIYDLCDSSHKVQFIPFTFNNEQNIMLLVCSDGYIYFFAGGKYLTQEGEIYRISHTYNTEDIGVISYIQSADVIFTTAQHSGIKTITRYGTNDFKVENFDTDGGAFMTMNTSDISLSGTGNTITASDDLFTSSDVGRYLLLYEAVPASEAHYKCEEVEDYTSDWLPCQGDWSIIMSGTFNGDIQVNISHDKGTTSENLKHWSLEDLSTLEDSGTQDDLCWLQLVLTPTEAGGTVQLNVDSFVHQAYCKITAVSSAKSVTVQYNTGLQGEELGVLGDFTNNYDWALDSWNSVNGYPKAVTLFQDRLVFASTLAEPTGVWLSATGDYYNFKTNIDETLADDPINVTLTAQTMNAINSMVSKNDLLGFSSGGVWKINSRSQSQGLTAENIYAQLQSFEGANEVTPLAVADHFLYVMDLGATVRDLAYNYSVDSYRGDDLTLLSRHLFTKHEIVSWCYAQEPDSLVWAVRDDGVLLSLTYVKEQEVYAWSKHTTQGEFIATASMRGENRSDVYFVVKRGSRFYVEYLSDRLEDDTVRFNYMDCSNYYEGEETSSISGLDYLEGYTVQILADGAILNEQKVVDGTITLPVKASYVRVGLGYAKSFTSMNLDVPRQDGTGMGRRKSTAVTKLLVRNSWGGHVRIVDACKKRRVENKLPIQYGKPIELFSGTKIVYLNSRDDIDILLQVEQDDPIPINMLSFMVDIALGG